MNRRPRRTAREIANLQARGRWVVIVAIAIGLSLILFFKFNISDESSKTFEILVGNPDLELPVSATDQPHRDPKASGQLIARPDGSAPSASGDEGAASKRDGQR